MVRQLSFRPYLVRREDRADGTILLRSGYDMSAVAERTGDWLMHWARETPEAVFLAERSGAGWRELGYGEAAARARALAAGLLARGLGDDTPIMILSANSIGHALLTLAAQLVGIPTVPLAEQYSLIPEARRNLAHAVRLTRPAMVYAEDAERFAGALELDIFEGLERVVDTGAGPGLSALGDIATDGGDIDAAAARVGPDTVAKILLTSGSTAHPKGVMTTHRMMCANQAQVADALPFLRRRPPRLVDWLPWNHVFGGSHNFNLVLANGGSLYIDGGKPVKGLIERSIENLSMVSATIAFNVPVGFAMLRDAMRGDARLRRRYFADLDMLFYAGASLPQEVWDDLKAMAHEVRGDVPLFTSSWGMTETAPACLIQHEPAPRPGIVGVPMTGVTVKLIPDAEMRCELRVRGPNVMTGYLHDPETTAAAFDDEGFLRTGDAMKFVDPEDPARGLRFDGRISEDFKLSTGTWVRAANLRLDLLAALGGLASDVVVCGADRDEIGLMVFPGPEATAPEGAARGGVIEDAGLAAALRERLSARRGEGSSLRVARALVLGEPPSIAEGEITAKGNLNFRRILARRAELLERLYDEADPAVIHI